MPNDPTIFNPDNENLTTQVMNDHSASSSSSSTQQPLQNNEASLLDYIYVPGSPPVAYSTSPIVNERIHLLLLTIQGIENQIGYNFPKDYKDKISEILSNFSIIEQKINEALSVAPSVSSGMWSTLTYKLDTQLDLDKFWFIDTHQLANSKTDMERILEKMKWAVKCFYYSFYVIYLQNHPNASNRMCPPDLSLEDFKTRYTQFFTTVCKKHNKELSHISIEDWEELRLYRNTMMLALAVCPFKAKKGLFTDIVNIMLFGKMLPTGGGQSLKTSLKLEIYERECKKAEILTRKSRKTTSTSEIEYVEILSSMKSQDQQPVTSAEEMIRKFNSEHPTLTSVDSNATDANSVTGSSSEINNTAHEVSTGKRKEISSNELLLNNVETYETKFAKRQILGATLALQNLLNNCNDSKLDIYKPIINRLVGDVNASLKEAPVEKLPSIKSVSQCSAIGFFTPNNPYSASNIINNMINKALSQDNSNNNYNDLNSVNTDTSNINNLVANTDNNASNQDNNVLASINTNNNSVIKNSSEPNTDDDNDALAALMQLAGEIKNSSRV
ncbi:MAG TPA: hypothetical protein VHD33_07775 [Legionellaceae bacterium]|nr:hypothetical protein [Legionellaceae bacterium]